MPLKLRSLWTIVCELLLFEFSVVFAIRTTVQIKNGTLEGLLARSRKGKEFLEFRGIPYALPPLGKLRFEPPQPAAAWSGVRSAKEDAEVCVQRNIYTHQEEIIGIEDCLYLNVYTPRLPSIEDETGSSSGFPVMVWFHGGGWVTGAGRSDYYAPKYFLDHDMVLVSLSYRLGPLGFLSTEDLVSPGNQGMKDQVQAIRWIKENIAAFNGDPNRVTLFGESAGGASVNYHMISPLSKGLFHRGIAQSGTVHCPWTLTVPGQAREKANKVAQLLNCPTDDSKSLIECLKTKDPVEIIATDREFQEFDYDPMIPFRPVIEPDHPGAFLAEDPVTASRSGNFLDIPWITGVTSEEGSLRVPALYGVNNGKGIQELNDDFLRIAPLSLLYRDTCPPHLIRDVSKQIREFYFGDKPIDLSTRTDVINMYSDAWFIHAAHSSVRDHLQGKTSPLYFYYFNYKGSSSFSKIFGDTTRDYGVSHADDLQYIFPVGEQLFRDTPQNEQDHKMVDVMTTLWYNFADTGNPTPEKTQVLPVKWEPVKSQSIEYLKIGNDGLAMSRNLLPDRVNFWDTLPIRADLSIKNVHEEIREEL